MKGKIIVSNVLIAATLFCFSRCQIEKSLSSKIDRFALVTRHNVVLNAPDTLGSLSVGNGEFAFTVDVTGLQTFHQAYENGIPLGTQTQWGWHSIPQQQKYTLNDVVVPYESCDGTSAPYPVQHSDGVKQIAANTLRSNPHRLHLGMIGLILKKENGELVKLSELNNIHQELDLWTGKIESTYQVEGVPVRVMLYSHPSKDGIAARIESPLIKKNRLAVKFDFPYGKDCHTCPGYDWDKPLAHQSSLIVNAKGHALVKRQLDTAVYFVNVGWSNEAILKSTDVPHHFELQPSNENDDLEFTVFFERDSTSQQTAYAATKTNSIKQWESFWTSGAAIDFSECTDPRAKELERRVVLSQYLTRIQSAGSQPPQETGLTMNSWFGKFHLEMHWWHAAHFSLWGRDSLLAKNLEWYTTVMPKAMATATRQGYTGARWQKMTDPYGNESPSNIGAFIIWQQPHPIYLAELAYRNNPSQETLKKYKDIVSNTAEFMASFVKLREGKYHLCHPLIPAQEIFKATETDDPTYELQYWYYGLATAQEWRKRQGLAENEHWRKVVNDLAPLPMRDNLYLPNSTTPAAYTDDQYRNDHPAVLGAYGFLPFNHRMDTTVMANTFDNIMKRWNWETTWGWDYPLLAMTAARLNKPQAAVNALLLDVQKNRYLVNGHNFQDDRLRLYLPGNGGLLAAVAMMAAGWDGNKKNSPGFPTDGNWNVKWEGFKPMP